MKPNVTIVTGSRVLLKNDSSWVHKTLDRLLVDGLLVSGGAAGPDLIAEGIASRKRMQREIWLPSGTLLSYTDPNDVHSCIHERWLKGEVVHRGGNAYLFRNEQMVKSTAKRFPHARMIALLASWSTTNGTKYTISVGKMMGLDIEIHERTFNEAAN